MRPAKFVMISAPPVLGFHVFVDFPSPFAQANCPLRGSCNLESGLTGRTNLLLFQDSEASNWASHFTGVSQPANWSTCVRAGFSRAPGASKPESQAATTTGGALDFDFTNAGLSDPEEMYLRYYIRFNDTWQRWGDGEK